MVAVRCRPFNQREKDQKEGKVITIKEGGYCGIENPSEPDAPPREFSFDFTYDDDSEQVTIYRNLGAPLLDKAFQGWNGTIFAYGQTGSGKSFSMTGSPDQPGIIRQMNEEMFAKIASTQAEQPDPLPPTLTLTLTLTPTLSRALTRALTLTRPSSPRSPTPPPHLRYIFPISGLHAEALLGHDQEHAARAHHPRRAHPAALAADRGVDHRAVAREVGEGALPSRVLRRHRVEDHRRAPRPNLDGRSACQGRARGAGRGSDSGVRSGQRAGFRSRASVAQHEAHLQPVAVGGECVVPLEAERERGRRGQRRAEVRGRHLAGRCGQGHCFGSQRAPRGECCKRRVGADDAHAHRDVTEVVRSPEARGVGHEIETPTR